MALGLYISVPFCRTKCTYCNFASDVFSRAVFDRYLDRVCSDLAEARSTAGSLGARIDEAVDSIYLGGGTPTVLDVSQLQRLFVTIRQNFSVLPAAEITVECAPGTLNPPMLDALLGLGVNRLSLGIQSFVDAEARAVGRLHTRQVVLEDLARVRSHGITNISLDLIAGLPHQDAASWNRSLDDTIASGVPHVSIYMLEVDDDSRLGRELLAGGTRYHAHFVPEEDRTAEFYEVGCERLRGAGIEQYEISNFCRPGWQSAHNLKYWTRQPYLGFGVDAHSMLLRNDAPGRAVRFATPDSLEAYTAGGRPQPQQVGLAAAFEETLFLGLRLNRGLDLGELAAQFGHSAVESVNPVFVQLTGERLLALSGTVAGLTPRGRLLSNEVFERLLGRWKPEAREPVPAAPDV